MMNRKRCAVIAVVALAAVCATAWAATAADLLEKGVYMEETVGDLERAIEAYRQVIADAEANRTTLAQAHLRLAGCYLKTGQKAQAVEELEKVITRYPGQTALFAEARMVLDGIVLVDPIVMMPPETFYYFEMGSPGRQVEKALNMLKGTPLENPLAAIGGGPDQPQTQAPALVSALLNPSMIKEFKKVRGCAVGMSEVTMQGPPSFVAVLYPGESDALRAIITAALGAAARPGLPVEGMQALHLPGSVSCAYDDNVVIVARPAERLAWCVRQYKGTTNEPSLASTNEALRMSREARQEAALTTWTHVSRWYASMQSMATQSPQAAQVAGMLQMWNSLVDFEHIGGSMTRLVIDEKSPYFETVADVLEGHPSRNFTEVPTLSEAGFEAVPSEAIAVVSFAVGGFNRSFLAAVAEHVKQAAGLDISQGLIADVEQITLFVLPPEIGAAEAGIGKLSPVLTGIGLLITSSNPQQTRNSLEGLLAAQNALRGAPAPDKPQAGAGAPVTSYRVAVLDGHVVRCHVGQAGRSTVLALSPETIRAAARATESGQSVLTGGVLQEHLGEISPGTDLLMAVNGRGAIMAAVAHVSGESGLDDEHLLALSQVADAFARTSITVRSGGTPTRAVSRLSLNELPSLGGVFPLLGQVSQLQEGARQATFLASFPEPEAVDIAHAAEGISLDGDLSDWADISSLPSPFHKRDTSSFRLCWGQEGLYGAVAIRDDSIRANPVAPHDADCVEVYLETDYARSPTATPNSFTAKFSPVPEQGAGAGHVEVWYPGSGRSAFVGVGTEPVSGARCLWAPTPDGYAVEFLVPAALLKPAAMQPGTKLGVNLLINNDGVPIEYFYNHKDDLYWMKPITWGAIRLAGGPS
ncbi:MAG: tetratricopeptide repeat protein [Planctomycetota bacterium]|jgi:tetratricopeptide (TPR) repeat protein